MNSISYAMHTKSSLKFCSYNYLEQCYRLCIAATLIKKGPGRWLVMTMLQNSWPGRCSPFGPSFAMRCKHTLSPKKAIITLTINLPHRIKECCGRAAAPSCYACFWILPAIRRTKCDVASFSDYSRLKTAKRDRCCPENRAICSDVWKRHSLAPATRHMNTQDQGRRQQETHTPTAKTIYRRNVRSPTTRHRIRNEKRARNQR